uniref:Uncharacterized protein n=1 Tax=Anopheles melas TaxID=34690 RepID=A0A182TQH8_9DIPT
MSHDITPHRRCTIPALLVRPVTIYGARLLYAVLAAEGAQSIVRWCKFKYINDVTDTASRPGSSAPGGSILGTPELFLTLAGALAATALTAIDGFTLYTEVRGQWVFF